jgi:hypothetical protein
VTVEEAWMVVGLPGFATTGDELSKVIGPQAVLSIKSAVKMTIILRIIQFYNRYTLTRSPISKPVADAGICAKPSARTSEKIRLLL